MVGLTEAGPSSSAEVNGTNIVSGFFYLHSKYTVLVKRKYTIRTVTVCLCGFLWTGLCACI
jgi:hypothetical protein